MSAYPPQPTTGPAGPVALPDYSVGFAEAVRRGFRRYVTFDGRAGRAEFWYWYLFVVGVELVLLVPTIAIGASQQDPDGGLSPVLAVGLTVFGMFYLAILLPTLAIACRRLHDAGFSGLYLLLGLITGLIPLIMCMLPTSPQAVRYGPPGEASPYGLPPGGYGSGPAYDPQQGYAQGYPQQSYPQQPPAPPYGQQPDQPQPDQPQPDQPPRP